MYMWRIPIKIECVDIEVDIFYDTAKWQNWMCMKWVTELKY